LKLYRLHNSTEPGPASPLHFLKREDCDAYKDFVRWPYQNDGRYPLHQGGSIPLDKLELRIEELSMEAVLLPELEWILFLRDHALGSCAMLPGDCFNPDSWQPVGSLEAVHPVHGPLIEAAKKRLQP
jgi:hypothetical protein